MENYVSKRRAIINSRRKKKQPILEKECNHSEPLDFVINKIYKVLMM